MSNSLRRHWLSLQIALVSVGAAGGCARNVRPETRVLAPWVSRLAIVGSWSMDNTEILFGLGLRGIQPGQNRDEIILLFDYGLTCDAVVGTVHPGNLITVADGENEIRLTFFVPGRGRLEITGEQARESGLRQTDHDDNIMCE